MGEHIIPQAFEKKYKDLFRRTGIDIKSPRNTIDLPTDRKFDPTKTIHCGNHCGKYNANISRELDDIEIRLNNNEISPVEAAREIEQLQDGLRAGLDSGEIDLNQRSADQPPERPSKDSEGNDRNDDLP